MTPPPTLCAHVDGWCLRDESGHLIDVFPNLQAAEAGLRAACVASVLMAETLKERTA